MMIHEITEKVGKYKSRKRIGRGHGSGMGKTSGRGHKGAGSRSGYSRRPAFEGGQMQYFRRIPKRGFTNAAFKTVYAIVNVASLQDRFKKGATVDATALVEAGLIRNFKSPVKILGNGDLSIALTVTADKVSSSAQKKIEDAGGTVTLIEKKKWIRENPIKRTKKKSKSSYQETDEVEEVKDKEKVKEAAKAKDSKPEVEETPQAAVAEEETTEEVVEETEEEVSEEQPEDPKE